MSANEPVEIMLDLRGYERRLQGPAAFIEFWEKLSPALQGRPLVADKPYELEHGSGSIRFTVIRNPPAQVTDQTRFAVHSLLEPPQLKYTCDLCRNEKRNVYGPFVCPLCKDAGGDGRVCDNHVVILDGSMRSVCRTHAPQCACGTPATFWCQGPECRRRKAWCDTHRKRHRNDPDHSYCEQCYAQLFPACEHAGCASVGTLACEFIDSKTLEPCERRACPSHMQRWQVHGPDEEGLALCSRHRGVRLLADDGLIFQIILGTATRRLRLPRSPQLPTLQSVRHILRKARGRSYDLHEIARLFEGFKVHLDKGSALGRELARLLASGAQRAFQPITSIAPPPISMMIVSTSAISASGIPAPAMKPAVPEKLPILPKPAIRKISASMMRPASGPNRFTS